MRTRNSSLRLLRASSGALLACATVWLLLVHAQRVEAGGTVPVCDDAHLNTALTSPGLVNFSCGPATIVLASTKIINGNTTIDGGNTITLSGGGALRLFVVNSGAVLTLTNITISGGSSGAGDGGAVYVSNGGGLSVIGTRFYSNTTTTTQGGGAISTMGALNISGSEFAYNQAGGGGALNTVFGGATTVIQNSTFHHNQTPNGDGGAIYLRDAAPMTLTNVSLLTNTSQSRGGAIDLVGSSSLIVISSLLQANTTSGDGGGIYSDHALTVLSSTLAYNHADQKGGALVANGSTLLSGTRLTGNTGYAGGGALYTEHGTTTIDHSTFDQNSTTNYMGPWSPQPGGAVMAYTATNLLVNSSVMQYNGIASSGGAIWSIGDVTVRDSTLYENSAWHVGGGLTAGGVVTINNSQIVNNFASGGDGIGAGVFVGAFSGTFGRVTGTVSISNSLLQSNQANGMGGIGGGGIYNEGLLTLTQTTLYNNYAFPYGGGLYNRGTAKLYTVTLSSNRGITSGGGIYNVSFVFGDQVTVTHNAAGFGGGIYNFSPPPQNQSDGLLWLSHVTLSDNQADGLGGGVLNDGWLLFGPSIIRNNTAAFGGALFNRSGIADIERALLLGNLATDLDGGGVYNQGRLSLTNATLSGNKAVRGGGVYNVANAWLMNVTLADNAATSVGGALDLAGGSHISLTNSIIANNVNGGNCADTGSIVSKYSISSDATCSLVGPGDHINLDPDLSALGDYGGSTLVQMPRIGSPAINGVVGSDAPSIDQRGMPRPVGGAYDIGAVERQPGDSDLAPRLYLPLIQR